MQPDELAKICEVMGSPGDEVWPEGQRLAAAMGFSFPDSQQQVHDHVSHADGAGRRQQQHQPAMSRHACPPLAWDRGQMKATLRAILSTTPFNGLSCWKLYAAVAA
jgi:hypothetical protein